MASIDIGLYGLKDKVAIVTGGGYGIGKGIALEMAKAGADVVISEVDSERAESTVNELKALGVKALKVVADVTKTEQVDKTFEQTLKEFGTVDVLVNNVGGILGVSSVVPFLEMEESFWDDIMTVNIKGTFLCTRAFVKIIRDQKKKGSIVNISSIADRVPWMAVLHYGAAKAAVSNLTMNMAVEFGKYGIRVNAVCPGRIETALSAELYRDRQDVRKAQLNSIPLGRFGLPEDIGRPAVFLASDAAGYISGTTLVVSGGLTHLF